LGGALEAGALIRAVERPGSDEAALLDSLVARGASAAVEAATLAEVARFFEEYRGRAYAAQYDALLRRCLTVEGAPAPARAPEGGTSIYNRRDFARSLLFSAVVGTALVLINVRPGQATGNVADGPDIGRIFLNYLVPFLVASFSAALANHARVKAARTKKKTT
jgi:hypothetical protein